MRSDAKALVGKANLPTEPSVVVGVSTGTVAGLVSLITLIFPNLSHDALVTIFVAVAFFLPLITGFLTRGKVWSPASVLEVIEQATADANKTNNDLNAKK